MATSNTPIAAPVQNQSSLIIPPHLAAVGRDIDNIVKEVIKSEATGFTRAILQATAISKIFELLSPEFMQVVRSLQNKKLGFLTDQPEGYKVETLKEVVTEALLNGLEIVGNHFNIIAGKCYFTKEGFTFLLKKLPNVKDDYTFRILKIENGIAQTKAIVTYGTEKKVKEIEFPVTVQNKMGSDAILGKLERKAKKWLYHELTGKDLGEGDTLDISHEEVSSTINITPNNSNNEIYSVEEQTAIDWLKKSTPENLEKRIAQVKVKLPNFVIPEIKL